MLPRPEPNGHGAPNGAELAQRIDTPATDSSAATDRYAAMWGSSNPTYPPALDEAVEIVTRQRHWQIKTGQAK